MSFKFNATDVVILGEGAVAEEVWASISAHDEPPRILFAQGSPLAPPAAVLIDPRDIEAFREGIKGFNPARVFIAGRLPEEKYEDTPAILEDSHPEFIVELMITGAPDLARFRITAASCVAAGLIPYRICECCCSAAHQEGCIAGPALPPPEAIQLAADCVRWLNSEREIRFAILSDGDEISFKSRLRMLGAKVIAEAPPPGAVVVVLPHRDAHIFECSVLDAAAIEACASQGVRALGIVTDEVIVVDFERIRAICDEKNLSLYRFNIGRQ